jgi:CRISPR-associated protein Csm1
VGHLFKKTEESDKGKALIYKIVALLRDFEDPSSTPRLAYLLARSFEGDGDRGTAACQKLHGWACGDPKELQRLIVALEWYVYTVREGR